MDNDSPAPDRLDALIERAKAGTLRPDEAAEAYSLIGQMRWLADKYERDLIRSLRWDADGNAVRTWAEVAEAVQAQLGSRQAAHARWGRLKSPARRTTTGDNRRGAAQPRDNRGSSLTDG